MNHIMAIFDNEENYATQFVNYLKFRNDFPFEVRNFSDIEKMHKFHMQQRIDVALIGEESVKEVRSFLDSQIIVLSQTGVMNNEGMNFIFKYQNCDDIVKKILTLVSESNIAQDVITRPNKLKIISFFSPVKRTYQTTFALTMGQLLSKKYRTLYINLEGFSGLGSLLNKNFTKDITDLLYYLQNGRNGFRYLLSSMVEKVNDLDIIPPMMFQLDLISIKEEEWIQLLNEIERNSDYEYLLLDLSESIQGLYNILRQSTYIYCMTKNDDYAVSKLEQYEFMLTQCKFDDLIGRIKKYCIPEFNSKQITMDRLLTSEMANYVKNIMREDLYE